MSTLHPWRYSDLPSAEQIAANPIGAREYIQTLAAENAELLAALKLARTVPLPPEITDAVYAAIAKAESTS